MNTCRATPSRAQPASHHLIHDHPHGAVLANGNDHRIGFNDTHRVVMETGDVGAI